MYIFFRKGYVYLVSLVAHFQIVIDAVFVNVGDGGHIGYTFISRAAEACCNQRERKNMVSIIFKYDTRAGNMCLLSMREWDSIKQPLWHSKCRSLARDVHVTARKYSHNYGDSVQAGEHVSHSGISFKRLVQIPSHISAARKTCANARC